MLVTESVTAAPGAALFPFGTNDLEKSTILENLFDEFKLVAENKMLAGMNLSQQGAERAVAILYKIIRVSEAEGFSISFTKMLHETAGKSIAAKLLNFAMKRLEVKLSTSINVTFGSVKSQMIHALDMLITEYRTDITPTVDQVEEYITKHGGIGTLSMNYMSKCAEARRLERQKEEDDRERGRAAREAAEAAEREKEAVDAGFDNYAEYQAHQQQVAQAARFDQVRGNMASRGIKADVAAGLQEGRFYLFLNGELRLVSAEDETTVLKCASSLI